MKTYQTSPVKYSFLTSKKNIFHIVSDILKNNIDTSVLIPNSCNTDNNIVSKFSTLIYDQYPIVKQNILLNHQNKIGTNKYITLLDNTKTKSQIIIANMFCESKNTYSKRNINYGALAMCMMDINKYCREYNKINSDKKIQIHSPKFGTGFSGGDWKTIANLIDDIWAKHFTTFIYEPNLN